MYDQKSSIYKNDERKSISISATFVRTYLLTQMDFSVLKYIRMDKANGEQKKNNYAIYGLTIGIQLKRKTFYSISYHFYIFFFYNRDRETEYMYIYTQTIYWFIMHVYSKNIFASHLQHCDDSWIILCFVLYTPYVVDYTILKEFKR